MLRNDGTRFPLKKIPAYTVCCSSEMVGQSLAGCGAVCPSPAPPLHHRVSWLPGCRDCISGAQWLWGGTLPSFPPPPPGTHSLPWQSMCSGIPACTLYDDMFMLMDAGLGVWTSRDYSHIKCTPWEDSFLSLTWRGRFVTSHAQQKIVIIPCTLLSHRLSCCVIYLRVIVNECSPFLLQHMLTSLLWNYLVFF